MKVFGNENLHLYGVHFLNIFTILGPECGMLVLHDAYVKMQIGKFGNTFFLSCLRKNSVRLTVIDFLVRNSSFGF